jgi:hypothetical protein
MKHTNIALMILLILIVVFSPFIAIWSLNTLFPVLAIPYTFETWLASLLLAGTLKTSTMKT